MNFITKMTANVTAQQAAQSARQAKDDSRNVLEVAVRQLVQKLQASSSVDDAERAALGITVADTIKTVAVGGISTRPIRVVDTSQRLRHEIRFSDEATPTKRAKPAGVMGCEIWVKVSAVGEAAPSSADELSFLSLDTASPYIAEYDGANGGKTAHYMLRWVKSDGKKWPWSETISATKQRKRLKPEAQRAKERKNRPLYFFYASPLVSSNWMSKRSAYLDLSGIAFLLSNN
jgi:hypothetical protein